MSSNLTQIAMDFGPEQQPQPVPAPTGNGAGEEAARPYLAAGGVGVRVKSFKQATPPPAAAAPDIVAEIPSRPSVKVVNGDLFGGGAPADDAPVAEAPPAAPAMGSAPAATTLPEPEIAAPFIAAPVVAAPIVTLPAAELTSFTTQSVEEPILAKPAINTPVVEPTPEDPRGIDEAPVVTMTVAEDEMPKTRRRTPPGRSTAVKAPSKRGRKSLKEVSAEAQLIDIPADEVLFSKQYYTMGEVSEMFRVNQSLLRFWETEFDILQPKKNKKGDRYFRPVDIKNLHLIYHLLRQKKYTIEGAKEFLKKNKKAEDRFEVIQRLEQIKAFLVEWKAQL